MRLWGIAAQEEPLMIVMEFCPGGSLLELLRSTTAARTQDACARYCLQAALGLHYLETHNCVHRDIAARNCLIGKNGDIKISDFGLSLEVTSEYRERKAMPLPIRWLVY